MVMPPPMEVDLTSSLPSTHDYLSFDASLR
jgi:hypothetical protein